MNYLSELKRELKEAGKLNKASYNNVVMMERAYIKDHPHCETPGCPNITNLTYDHIIPKAILSAFNIDASLSFWDENSETLCYACNHRKGQKLDLSNSKTKPLLLELLNNIGIIK